MKVYLHDYRQSGLIQILTYINTQWKELGFRQGGHINKKSNHRSRQLLNGWIYEVSIGTEREKE